MIKAAHLFAQFGGGREGWWDQNVWYAVLSVLHQHEGEAYSPSANPALFEDIETALGVIGVDLAPRGEDDSRSVFRAASAAWVETGVVQFDNAIHLTVDGHAVLAGERSFEECLRFMFGSYRERRNSRNPFRPIIEMILDGQSYSFIQIFEAVQRESGPELNDWISATQIPGFPYFVEPNSGNPTRSVRFLLRLLQQGELVEEGSTLPGQPTVWKCADGLLARQVLAAATINVQVSDQPPASGSGLIDFGCIADELSSNGWQFEPWQVAVFCNAVKTKPFVVLAGISGTGKTKLPRLVATATGASHTVIPVRPDWRDSSDLLGYTDLSGRFHPGPLLRAAKIAIENPGQQHFVLLDEMNLARVEYYFAEVLSLMEERQPWGNAMWRTDPLLSAATSVRDEDNEEGIPWSEVFLPSNLALLGSVNMDETTHPFSRKVLDRAFVIEFSDADLGALGGAGGAVEEVLSLDSSDWTPIATRLIEHPEAQSEAVRFLLDDLVAMNEILKTAQLQVGYRLRDEVALFVLNLKGGAALVDGAGREIDPVDLAFSMKILPRIQGGGLRTRELLAQLAAWAGPEDQPRLPLCSARIQLLVNRFDAEGFTSFWL